MKAYRYRIEPDEKQVEFLAKQFGCCRFVYNWALDLKTKAWQTEGKGISVFEISRQMTLLKKEKEWLSEVASQPLQQSLIHLDKAFTGFFKKKTDYPRYKSKWGKQSASFPQNVEVEFSSGTIVFPKVGRIKARFSRTFTGVVKTVTITKTVTGKYFASVLVESENQAPVPVPDVEETAVGLDLGLTHFLTLSTGEKIEHPNHLEKDLDRIKTLHQRVSRKKKGSKNRRKAIVKLALAYERVSNKRDDFLQKVSTRLVRDFGTLCFEDLNVAGMMKNRHLSRHIGQSGWSKFKILCEGKASANGKHIRTIGRFEPSSKLCSCGYRNKDLSLSDRIWTCPVCKTTHDRDILAANNIKRFAFAKQNTSGSTGGESGEMPVNKRDRRTRKSQE